MPAVVCHWIHGRRLLDRAKALAGAENFYETAFLCGCQGPDVLFYHRLVSLSRKKSLYSRGSSVHTEHPSVLFASVLRTLSGLEKDSGLYGRVLSYALGLCCHYAYDTCAHPYICQLSEHMKHTDERGENYHYHAFIESALDVIMYRWEEAGLITDLRLGKCVRFERGDCEAAALIWGNILEDYYGEKPEQKELLRLLPHMRRLFRLLDDPVSIRRPIVMKIERLIGSDTGPMSAYMRPFMEDDSYDYANIAKEEWCNFMDENQRSCEDFFEITDRAETAGEEFMRFFMTSPTEAELSAYTGERSFSNNVDERRA